MSFHKYHGLMSQIRGTRKALKKNIIVYSSTIPYFSVKTLSWVIP
jgi:hypothetical protein